MKVSRAHWVWWHLLHLGCWCAFVPLYRYRSWGSHHVPPAGKRATLLLVNHQSFYDPILMGMGVRRPFHALARATLWDQPVVGALCASLNSIPVDQEASDVKGLRRCIEVLRGNGTLMLFPEGERTLTGDIGPFAAGTMLLLRRAKPLVVPVAIEGAYDVFNRRMRRPRLTGRIGVMFGRPIKSETLLAMKSEEALDSLRTTVESMRQEVARRLASRP